MHARPHTLSLSLRRPILIAVVSSNYYLQRTGRSAMATAEAPEETRTLLGKFVAVGVFKGIEERPCR